MRTYSFQLIIIGFFCAGLLSCSSSKSIVSSNNDEQINQGYGTIDSKNSTTAISEIDMDNEEDNVSWMNLFQRTSGVTVKGDGNDISLQIRAKKTMNSGDQPLFVVDDRIMGNGFHNISFIDPMMVDRISILKDGASTSIYGSRGADGVILITLKK